MAGAMDHRPLGMAVVVSDHRLPGFCLADTLACHLLETGRTCTLHEAGASLHPGRPHSGAAETSLDRTPRLPPNLDLCTGEVSDRPDLVVLSFLDPGLHAAGSWLKAERNFPARVHDLFDFGHRQRRRRVDLLSHDPARAFGQRRKKMDHARLRALRGADRADLSPVRSVVCHFADRAGRSGTPGLLGKSVYAQLRPFSVARGRLRRRDRRDGGRHRRDADCRSRGSRTAVDKQLHDSILYCCFGLFPRTAGDSFAQPEARACRDGPGLTPIARTTALVGRRQMLGTVGPGAHLMHPIEILRLPVSRSAVKLALARCKRCSSLTGSPAPETPLERFFRSFHVERTRIAGCSSV